MSIVPLLSRTTLVTRESVLIQYYISCKTLVDVIKACFGPNGRETLIVDTNGNTLVSKNAKLILSAFKNELPGPKIATMITLDDKYKVGDGQKSIIILSNQVLKMMHYLHQKGFHVSILRRVIRSIFNEAMMFLSNQVTLMEITREGLIFILDSIEGGHDDLRDCLVSSYFHTRKALPRVTRFDWQYLKIIPMQSSKISLQVSSDCVPIDSKSPQIKELTSHNALITCHLTNQFQQNLGDMFETLASHQVSVIVTCEKVSTSLIHSLHQKGITTFSNLERSDIFSLADHLSTSLENVEISKESIASCQMETVIGLDFSYLRVISPKMSPFCTLNIASHHHGILDKFQTIIEQIDGQGCIKTVPGGGSIELSLSKHLNTLATHVQEDQQSIYTIIASCFLCIPRLLTPNMSTTQDLDSQNVKSKTTDLAHVKHHVLKATLEIVDTILSLDCVISQK